MHGLTGGTLLTLPRFYYTSDSLQNLALFLSHYSGKTSSQKTHFFRSWLNTTMHIYCTMRKSKPALLLTGKFQTLIIMDALPLRPSEANHRLQPGCRWRAWLAKPAELTQPRRVYPSKSIPYCQFSEWAKCGIQLLKICIRQVRPKTLYNHLLQIDTYLFLFTTPFRGRSSRSRN